MNAQLEAIKSRISERLLQRARLSFCLSLLLCSLSVGSVRAQIGEYRSDFAVGVSGGYSFNRVGFLPKVPQDMHKGYTGGITVRYLSEKYFTSICAIVGELNLVQMGWKEKILTNSEQPVINRVTGLPEEYQRDLTYLQVPVFARMGWGRERRGMQFFFQAGPQFCWLLKEKTKMNFEWNDHTPSYVDGTGRSSPVLAQDTMSVQHRFDYGITAGLGLEFSHPKVGHFLLEGRYFYGLGDMYGNTKRDFFARSNNSNIIVKLTYMFDLKRTKNPKIK